MNRDHYVSGVPELLALIVGATSSKPAPRLIAIDGGGGSGKTTLANELAVGLRHAPIVHTDDFASPDNPVDWWPSLLERVLQPLSRGESAWYQRYDWHAKRLGGWVELAPRPYVILEGVTASREAFRPYLAYAIWIDAAPEVRLARGLRRDGNAAKDQWLLDMANEDAYMARERPADHANALIKT